MGTSESHDTVEGVGGDSLAYHFDVTNDVLYLRLISTQEVFGEETPEGFLLFRTEDEKIAGMTIIGYWKRFGEGRLADIPRSGLQMSMQTRVASLQLRLAA